MSELQATVEFAIELCKFYNVDLFQRGLYQVRCGLRVPPKQPVQTEVSVPETGKALGSASVLGNGGACRPFQILYRNEEVSLQDMILFRCHMLVDSRRLRESLERAEFSLVIELWFSEQPHQSMVMVSTRTLQLNFSPSKGLHYHLPVLFDYFHLSAVSITIHATLVALHQPYINTPRSAKPWLGSSKFRAHQINNTSMESVFQSGTKCGGSGINKLAQARLLHQNVCEVLLEAHQNLQVSFKELLQLLPQWQQIQNSTHRNATQRLKKLCDSAKLMDMEEDFTARANSDVAQLCAENIVQWQNFLTSVSGKAVVHQHLAKKHHALRVKRFAEAFFVVDNPRHSAAGCYDANYQNYLAISELARRSKYLVTLPPLPVHCVTLDGDQTTMPIIFEDQYQDTLEFARRRSGVPGKKAGSEPFLSSKVVGEPSPVGSTGPPDKEDCSCGIAQILESRSNSRAGVMGATQVLHAGHAVQASLNITPHTALPARHSKSLDHLRMAGHGHFATMPTRSCGHHEERKRQEEHNGCPNGRQQGRRRLPYASKSTVDLALRSEPSTIERTERRSLRKHYECQNASKSTLDLILNDTQNADRRSPRKHFEFHNTIDLGAELPQVQRPNPEKRSPKKHYEFHRTHRRNQHHQDQQAPPPPRPLSEPQHSNTSAHPKHQHCRSADESERLRRVTADGVAQQFPRSNSTQIFPPNRQDLDVIFHHSTLILSRNKERPMTPNYRSDPERRHQYNRHRQQQHGGLQQQQPHGGLQQHNLKQHDLQQQELHQQEVLQQELLQQQAMLEQQEILKQQELLKQHDMSKRANCSISNRSNVDSTNTFPRYNQNSRVNKCNISKEDYNKNSSITNRYKCSTNTSREPILTSSSTDSESIPNGNSSKRLHTSASVPHHLARGPETQPVVNSDSGLRHVRSASSVLEELFPLATTASESLPNLAQPDQRIVSLSTSGSTSSLTSERSGWVSSHSVSEISSPEPAPTSASGQIGPPVNGEQLRNKLYELVAGQHQKRLEQAAKNKQQTTQSGYNRANGRHDDIKLTMLDDGNKYMVDMFNYSSGRQEDTRNGVKTQLEHPYIKKEIPLAVQEKDSTSGYEEVRLPPPKQFRDVPLPPEPFRDPSPGPGPSPAIDNLLYHVYETIQDDIKKSKSNTDLADKIEDFLAAEEIQQQKLPTDEVQQLFMKARNEFKGQLNFSGMLYSDLPTYASTLPYFHISDEYRIFSPEGMHLIVCVHGLDGNSADLRLVKTYLELGLPGSHLEFLMSERNQGDTFSDFDTMTDRLVGEILYHMESCGMRPSRISFVGHSLGNIIIRSALTRPQMKPLLSRLHTFLSLSGPHLGTLYNSSGLVNMGMWFMQKWKKSGSLLQLCLRDASDVRQSFLYRLSQRSTLHHFKNVLLCGSSQDRYVPLHSARLELCKAAIRDTTALGSAYREMVHNVVSPMLQRRELTLVRYDVHHALPHTANALIGRAAHIAVLDSELFIEKFLVVAGLKYFR